MEQSGPPLWANVVGRKVRSPAHHQLPVDSTLVLGTEGLKGEETPLQIPHSRVLLCVPGTVLALKVSDVYHQPRSRCNKYPLPFPRAVVGFQWP